MKEQDQHNLKPGTILNNYEIIRVLGEGGFGITYLAKDVKLGMKVVIKEYFPNEFSIRKNDSSIISKSSSAEDFARGMKRFEEEAKIVAKFNHPSIVKILGYFEENNTAYFVMEYEEGIDLAQYLKEKGASRTQEEILGIMMPILEGLKEVHAHNYLHRDIKPGNILLRVNKSPVLIDFGASKLALGEASKSITSMLTEGYAPLEQYSTDIKQQGSFTDIYATAAVIYKMITGEVPPSAQTRSYQLLQDDNDPFVPLTTLNLSGYDSNFLKAVDRALSMKAKDRPQNVQEFQADIAGELKLEKKAEKSVEVSKNNNSGVIITIIIVGILLGAGYFYTEQKNNSSSAQIAREEVATVAVDNNKEPEKTKKELADLKQKQQEMEEERVAREEKRRQEVYRNAERQKQEDETERLREEQEEIERLRREKAQAQKEELENLRQEKAEREKSEVEKHNYRTKQELDEFLKDFYNAGKSNDISKALVFYSYPIKTYFGKKDFSKTAVSKDKARYYKKWPKRFYQLENYQIISDESKNGIQYFTVVADVSWQVQSNKKTLNGSSSNILEIKLSNGRFYIGSVDEYIKKKKNASTVVFSNHIKTFTFDGVHEIKGTIQKVHHFGPPGYGEDPKNDQRLTAYILQLKQPIKVIEAGDDDLNFTTQTTEVQLLAFEFQKQLDVAVKKHKKVILTGEFFSAHTGYHIRKLLIDVKSFQILQ